jgi:hypothetical protein
MKRTLLRAALLFPLAAAAQPLTLTSPRDYQVFQRQTRTTGTVLVSGRTATECDRVEARASGPWAAIPFDAAMHQFHGNLAEAAGGFFAVEVRLLRAGEAVAQVTVPHVGVGEVFIIAGQSNATNYGEERQQTKSGMVVTFSGEEWRIADDPQPGVQDTSRNGSFIPAFGDALYEKLRVPIAVACVGHGSTSVRQWLPKGERFRLQPTMTRFVEPAGEDAWESTGQLFEGMMRRIRQLGDHGFRALLWHQGESDAHQKPEHGISADEYGILLKRVIQASRAQAGWDFPWFVAQVSYHVPDDPSAPEIRAAQASLWRSGIALEGPDTDRLTGDNRQNNGKGVHFSAKGLEAHGRLWAEKVFAYLDRH